MKTPNIACSFAASALLAVGLILPQSVCAGQGSAGSPARKPNVVLIMADDLGFAELGCYGQKKIRTPNVDRLAAEGLRFTRFYAGFPVCAPSRCALMTGKHAGHCAIRDNRKAGPEGQSPLPNDEITVAELLKQQGYATGAMGKWGLGGPDSEGVPLRQGFDRFFGYLCQSVAHNHYPTHLWDDEERIRLEGNSGGPTGRQFSHDLFETKALDFIQTHKDQPFFLYLPFTISHLALQVPEDSLAEYRGLWDDPPYNGGHGYLPHPAPRAAYAAMVTRMDRSVGRIVELIGKLGLDEETLILFTSDNGPTYDRLGGSDSDFFQSSAGLRGLKGSVYEGGIRVPLIARWKGKVAPGTTSDLPGYFPDMLPTLLDVAGAAERIPPGIDGLSLAPTLLGRPQDQRRHDLLYWEFPSYGGQQAVQIGPWKGVRQNLAKGKTAIELYHLETDPSERQDVAAANPEVVARIERALRENHTPSKLFPLQTIDVKR